MLYINLTIALLIALLPVIVQSSAVQSMFSKIAQKEQLKYDHAFKAPNQLRCSFSNCVYFHFENELCYTATHPMKSENNKIHARYYARNLTLAEEKCHQFTEGDVFMVYGSCVWVSEIKLDWTGAKQRCEAEGGHLIVPSTVGVHNLGGLVDWISDLNLTVKEYWVGASDLAREGDWRWADGTRVNVTDPGWNVDEPNNYGGTEDCAEYWFGYMNDAPCNLIFRFICGFI